LKPGEELDRFVTDTLDLEYRPYSSRDDLVLVVAARLQEYDIGTIIGFLSGYERERHGGWPISLVIGPFFDEAERKPTVCSFVDRDLALVMCKAVYEAQDIIKDIMTSYDA